MGAVVTGWSPSIVTRVFRPPILSILFAVLFIAAACTGERPTLIVSPVADDAAAAADGDTTSAGGTADDEPFEETGTNGERQVEPADGDELASPPATLAGRPPQSTVPPSLALTLGGDLPALPNDGVARALRTPSGVVVDVIDQVDGGYLVLTPCANEVVVSNGEVITGAHVVLDAGHGGSEPGAVGPRGSKESQINLAIAERVEALLTDAGVTVVQTRTADYRISILARTAIANSIEPNAFVSIHHNAAPDGPIGKPGAETYYQHRDPESRRLAGLVYEEALAEFSNIDIEWAGDTDAGAKFRQGESGDDYYGVLRRSAGVPATLTELLYLSNPPEEELLLTPAFQQLEAEVLSRAILRFLTTQDPGSGYVDAYPRTAPAGGGGGTNNCEDPSFG